jgi:glycosyltransferase involved in cell wall biosynthesis
MPTLRISVVIPTYNRAHLIGRALDSVLPQLTDDDEIIVIDDESRDNTEDVVRGYGARLRYFRISNQGAGRARNFGIAQCRSELVAFLDSDDEWMPHKIALQRQVMQSDPAILFCFSDFAVTDKQGRPFRRFQINWSRDHRGWDEILGPGQPFSSVAGLPEGIADFRFHCGDLSLSALRSAYVLTSSLMVRRTEAGGALRFAEDVTTLEDLECFGRLSLKGKAAYLDIETAWQHGHSGERLTDLAGLNRSDAHLKILERVWGADHAFLHKHGEAYRQTLETVRRHRTADLIALGRTAEARTALRQLAHPPVSYRLMAVLPGPIVRLLVSVRQRLAAR